MFHLLVNVKLYIYQLSWERLIYCSMKNPCVSGETYLSGIFLYILWTYISPPYNAGIYTIICDWYSLSILYSEYKFFSTFFLCQLFIFQLEIFYCLAKRVLVYINKTCAHVSALCLYISNATVETTTVYTLLWTSVTSEVLVIDILVKSSNDRNVKYVR